MFIIILGVQTNYTGLTYIIRDHFKDFENTYSEHFEAIVHSTPLHHYIKSRASFQIYIYDLTFLGFYIKVMYDINKSLLRVVECTLTLPKYNDCTNII